MRSHLLIFGVLLLALPAWPAAGERIVWRRYDAGVLKVDDRAVELWEVYSVAKKGHLLLVQLGQRFLLLNTKEKEVHELDPAGFVTKGKSLEWEDADNLTSDARDSKKPAGQAAESTAQPAAREKPPGASAPYRAAHTWPKRLATADWVVRDAGAALLVRVRLVEEGRVLEVQVPLPPDWRVPY